MKAKLLGLLTALALVGTSHAQQKDPYADSYRQQQLAQFRQQIEAELNLVRSLYFADGCRVFEIKDADAYTLYFPTYYQLYRKLVGQFNELASSMAFQTEAAKRDGRARALQPGACDYWHQHPEAVYEMRHAASSARR